MTMPPMPAPLEEIDFKQDAGQSMDSTEPLNGKFDVSNFRPIGLDQAVAWFAANNIPPSAVTLASYATFSYQGQESEEQVTARLHLHARRAERELKREQDLLLGLIQKYPDYSRVVMAALSHTKADDVIVNLEGPLTPEDVRGLVNRSEDGGA